MLYYLYAAKLSIIALSYHIFLSGLSTKAAVTLTKNLNPIKLGFKQLDIPQSIIKTYSISDLHADSTKNTQWVQNNCYRKPEDTYINDIFTILLLPGDICTEIDRLENIFQWLTSQYNMVCFVPGNHELWRRGTSTTVSATQPELRNNETNRMAENSIDKFHDILSTSKKYSVYIEPVRITSLPTNHSVCIIPLYSWYHANFDTEPEITNIQYLQAQTVIPFQKMWSDFSMCSWPEELIQQEEFTSLTSNNTILAEYFADINEQFLPLPTSSRANEKISDINMVNTSKDTNTNNIIYSDTSSTSIATTSTTITTLEESSRISIQETDTIISFSHFVPRQELCPEKRFLVEPGLTRVMGSLFLEAQIRRINPHVHVFGHTHISIDLVVEGIRYLQWPLGYNRESLRQCGLMHQHGPLLLADTSIQPVGILPHLLSLSVNWTKYYNQYKRNASIVDIIAPWTQKRIDGFSGLIDSVLKSRAAEETKPENAAIIEVEND